MLICFLMVMGYISYLGAGYYGLLATTVAMIATASRIFDAITDPIIAFIVEWTDGKFGRYRPTMILGWIISAIALLCMYFFCVGTNVVTFILIYVVYVIGYSFMMTSQGGARVAFTNEPVQRNRLGLFMGILTSFFSVCFSFYNTNYLIPKHNGVIDLGTMQELCWVCLPSSCSLQKAWSPYPLPPPCTDMAETRRWAPRPSVPPSCRFSPWCSWGWPRELSQSWASTTGRVRRTEYGKLSAS